VPKPFQQIVVINGLYKEFVVPLVFALSTGKTIGHYRQIFQVSVILRNTVHKLFRFNRLLNLLHRYAYFMLLCNTIEELKYMSQAKTQYFISRFKSKGILSKSYQTETAEPFKQHNKSCLVNSTQNDFIVVTSYKCQLATVDAKRTTTLEMYSTDGRIKAYSILHQIESVVSIMLDHVSFRSHQARHCSKARD
jgi:hypothetical protein